MSSLPATVPLSIEEIAQRILIVRGKHRKYLPYASPGMVRSRPRPF